MTNAVTNTRLLYRLQVIQVGNDDSSLPGNVLSAAYREICPRGSVVIPKIPLAFLPPSPTIFNSSAASRESNNNAVADVARRERTK